MNMKLVFSIALFITLQISIYAQHNDPESDFSVVRNNNGNSVIIIKYTGTKQEVIIPSQYHGLPVTIIGADAFRGKNLTSIVIPDSVTSIEARAFYNNQLTNVSIPHSIKTIEIGSFSSNQLTSIDIPESVRTIGIRAFYDNQLTNVIIPNNVRNIGVGAFSKNQLTSITIGANVELREAFDYGFSELYRQARQRAGNYVFRNGSWSEEWQDISKQ